MPVEPRFALNPLHPLGGMYALWVTLFVLLLALDAPAQNCQTSSELDDAPREAITTAAQRFFNMAAKGDVASMRQNATANLAADFSFVENTIKDRQPDLADAQITVRSIFLLEAEGTAPIPNAEFYCGVFGKNGQTPGSAEVFLENLHPAKYAVVVLDASSKAKLAFTLFLQQEGTDWKIAGVYIRPAGLAGHDNDWFINQARQFKSKGQLLDTWFYYLLARNLILPAPFMSTMASDKLDTEFQAAQPADLPANGKPADLTVGTTVYKLTAIFPQAVGNDLDLIVKHQFADASNATQAYQANVAVIKALVAKYPQLRDAFTGIVARAQDNSGHDYGTLLAMKDIK